MTKYITKTLTASRVFPRPPNKRFSISITSDKNSTCTRSLTWGQGWLNLPTISVFVSAASATLVNNNNNNNNNNNKKKKKKKKKKNSSNNNSNDDEGNDDEDNNIIIIIFIIIIIIIIITNTKSIVIDVLKMIAFIYIATAQTREFLHKKMIKFNTLNKRLRYDHQCSQIS